MATSWLLQMKINACGDNIFPYSLSFETDRIMNISEFELTWTYVCPPQFIIIIHDFHNNLKILGPVMHFYSLFDEQGSSLVTLLPGVLFRPVNILSWRHTIGVYYIRFHERYRMNWVELEMCYGLVIKDCFLFLLWKDKTTNL